MDKRILWVLLVGLFLRFISINQSLWLDEATSVIIAKDFTFSEIITKFSPGDFHPPLYYLLLKVWMSVVGSSEVAARMLSVLFGVLTIWVVYKIAKQLFTNHQSPFGSTQGGSITSHIPFLSALFLATAPLHIYYSQEARMYAAETLIATIVVYFVAKVIRDKKLKPQNLVWLTLSSVVLLYTDYLPIFLLVSLFIFLTIYHKKYLPYLFGWICGTALLLIPWIPTFLTQLQSGMGARENAPLWWVTLGKTNIKELTLVPVKFIVGRISSYDKVFYGTSVAAAAVPFVFSIFHSLLQFSKTKLLWFWLLWPLILAAIFGALFSGFSYFRLIFVLPAFYLIVAFGALTIKNSFVKEAVIFGVILVNLTATGIYLANPRFHREDWRSAVAWIEENSGKQAGVVFVSKNQRDPYYYYAKSVPSFGPEGAELGFNKIFLVRYVQPIFDPKDELRDKIEKKGYTKVEEKDFNGVVVWRYDR